MSLMALMRMRARRRHDFGGITVVSMAVHASHTRFLSRAGARGVLKQAPRRSRSGAAAAARARAAATRPPPVARRPRVNQIRAPRRRPSAISTRVRREASAGPPRWAAQAAAAAAPAAAALGRARASVAAARRGAPAAAASVRSAGAGAAPVRPPGGGSPPPKKKPKLEPKRESVDVSREEKDAMIAQLVGMGYPTDKARRGLRRSGWDVSAAVERIENGGAEK